MTNKLLPKNKQPPLKNSDKSTPQIFDNATKQYILDQFNSSNFLTAKQLYEMLTKHYNLEISYQGVHKQLQELVRLEILQKQKVVYVLSKSWINSMKKYSDLLFPNQINGDSK